MKMDNSECLLPADFLLNISDLPPISYFIDENNQVLTEEESDKRVVFEEGKYTRIDPGLRVLIMGSKEEKLQLITEVIFSQMKRELQFGNVLDYPNLSEDLERLIKETLAEYEPLHLMSDICRYSQRVLSRSTYACGVGIALGLFSHYAAEKVKAIGMGCLLHEYGYLINPGNHSTAGSNNLERRFFTGQTKMEGVILNIIETHHSIQPNKNPVVDCGKIAIHWASQEEKYHLEKMVQLTARKRIYHPEVFSNFSDLFELMQEADGERAETRSAA